MTTKIQYGHYSQSWPNYSELLQALIGLPTVRTICEIGGGANPMIPLSFIENHNLEYTIIDISEAELQKAPDGYYKLQGDISDPNFIPSQQYDLVFSMQLAEHIKYGLDFHKNIFNLLKENGYAFHFFPTLYAPPFFLNKLLPQSISNLLILWHSPNRKKEGNRGKFPAYYDCCYGPLKSQILKLESLGYQVEEYVGFFGHDYYEKVPLFKSFSDFITSLLLHYPIPSLTSYAYVLLSKS